MPLLLVVCWSTNSCKKNNPDATIGIFLARDWRLASQQVANYVGDSVRRDTLNTNCDKVQVFGFKSDGSCTYRNYDCVADQAQGNWSLSNDRVILYSDVVCKDASSKTFQPFKRASILNLGQNSLVLEVNDTIDTIRLVPLTVRRKVTRYGFIP
ncbi:hypothetical protein KHS38_06130 [Mucilaginibacter sp. Bleaf8]|uniref:hypothetical protein n=1 Tax=Mucilaginibacter sp. Bleaf8 TaxID=2834430 RepID=UPI001BCD97CD|nr:hypothetical protein [Mucilaginibacter sp. Bleaf8]MBS7563977.1 hypothetical protein [Mucilaginibacter sp. Bleaf8]